MNIFDSHIPTDPVIERYKEDVDVGLIRENLKLTVEDRLKKLQEHLLFVQGLRGTAQKAQARKS